MGDTGAAEEKQDCDEQNMESDRQEANKMKREGNKYATNARWRAIRFELIESPWERACDYM